MRVKCSIYPLTFYPLPQGEWILLIMGIYADQY